MQRARTKKSGLASIYARITTGGMRQHESDIKSSTKMPQNRSSGIQRFPAWTGYHIIARKQSNTNYAPLHKLISQMQYEIPESKKARRTAIDSRKQIQIIVG